MGMIRGDLSVAYDSVREVTAEVRKWCTLESVSYADTTVSFSITLMPHYYDGLTGAVSRITGGRFDFRSELQPPLFVADIGSMQQKLAAAVGDEKPDGAGEDVVGGDAANSSPVVLLGDDVSGEDASATRSSLAAEASERYSAQGGGRITSEDVEKHQLRLARVEAQDLVDRYFRQLAGEGQHAALTKLYHRGLQVREDPEARGNDRSAQHYVKKRALQLQAVDDADEKVGLDVGTNDGRGSGGTVAGTMRAAGTAAGVRVRVYPDVNAADGKGNTAVMQAARNGWVALVRELVRMGGDVGLRNLTGQDALALARGESSAASLAVRMGVPGAADRRRRAAELVKMLDGRSLMQCAKQGDLRRVRFMVEDLFEDPNAANGYGMTPLHFAVMNKDVEMTKLLVANGADAGAANNIEQTPESIVGAMPADDALAQALIRALQEGAELGRAHATMQQNAVAEEVGRMRARAGMARSIRQYTRGTTAAASVFPAFSAGRSKLPEADLEEEAKRRIRAARAKRAPVAKRPARAPGHSGPSPALGSRMPHGPSRTEQAHGAGRASAVSAQEPADRTGADGRLVPSWERHALDYAVGRAHAKRVADARMSRRNGSEAARVRDPRAGETAPAAASAVSIALSGGGGSTAALASAARWDMSKEDGVPGPDSAMFEKWLRMRFGVT